MLPKPIKKTYYWLLAQKPVGEWIVYAITFFYHMAIILFRIKPTQDRTALIIVSHKYKFIYIGIPKVATRAFKGALIEKGQAEYESEFFETAADLQRVLKHYPDYFRFSITRNPWDRIVSCYNSKIAEGTTYSKYVRIMAAYKDLKPQMPFEAFCEWLLTPMGGDAYADRHWLSQHVLIGEKCDYVGKYENLEEEIKIICEKIGCPVFDLPQRGHISSKHDPFTPETRAMIAQRYKEDIERYGYEE